MQTNPDGFTALVNDIGTVTRVTSSAGTASYSWTDKHAVSGKFVTSAVGQSGTPGTHTFYRLDAAADFAEVNANDTEAFDNGDTLAQLVEWDSTDKDFTILKAVGAAATHPLVTYMKYSYDANDHFVIAAEVAEGTGSATTMALWEAQMLGNSGTAATWGGVALVDYEALSTGISQFSEGDD